MRAEIEKHLPDHVLKTSSANPIYIVDYKNLNGGDVELLENEPQDIKSVVIENNKPVKVCFDGFKDNSLEIGTGRYSRQCECVLFPDDFDERSWILFIETKYANNLQTAFKEENDYPNCMVEQIIETVAFFRNKGIIPKGRRVNAIVSFPNLIAEFNSSLFRKTDRTIEDILVNHQIRIRATNSANITSEKRLILNSI